jgi:RNA polymerase sigma factor (sigma-70 family)
MEASLSVKITDFLSKERNKMVSFVRKRIDDASDFDAEDIVQDVMLNIFDSADVSFPVGKLAGYIYASLKNRIVDYLRSRRQKISIDDSESAGFQLSIRNVLRTEETALSGMEREELVKSLYSAIGSLDEEEQEVIFATEFEGIPFRELSEEWGVPIGTLLSKKARAIDKIREIILKKEG